MSTHTDFVENDTAAALKATLVDDDTGAAIDLTGSTVNLNFKCFGQPVLTRAMTIDANPATGIARYQFAEGELEPGAMQVEIEILFPSGRLTSLQTKTFPVRHRLGE